MHLIGNKAEGKAADPGLMEAYSLGFGEPVAISAEHGQGLADLHAIVSKAVDAAAEKAAAEALPAELDQMPEVNVDLPEDDGSSEDGVVKRWDPNRHLNVAIIGRPNAGKSTLINRMVGEERLLTGPEAGITRDLDPRAVGVWWARHQPRRYGRHAPQGAHRSQARKAGGERSSRSIQYAEVVVLLLDAQIPFEKQDLALADLVEREGRAMVIAVNKWDTIEDKNEKLAELREQCERYLPQLKGIPLVTISGLQGRNIDKLMQAIFAVEQRWNGACVDGQAQPLARRDDRDPSATGRIRAPAQAALHDAGEDPAAELHHFCFAPRGRARDLISAIWSTACARHSTCRARRSGCRLRGGKNPFDKKDD